MNWEKTSEKHKDGREYLSHGRLGYMIVKYNKKYAIWLTDGGYRSIPSAPDYVCEIIAPNEQSDKISERKR